MAAASLKRCPSKVVDCVSGEVLVGSVYLKSAVGLQCYPNTQIIAALILELKGRKRWILGGDWNPFGGIPQNLDGTCA